jgi:hypothetical protein
MLHPTSTLLQIQHEPGWLENFAARRKNGEITTSDLMWFAVQIARAMDYLEKNKVSFTLLPEAGERLYLNTLL